MLDKREPLPIRSDIVRAFFLAERFSVMVATLRC